MSAKKRLLPILVAVLMAFAMMPMSAGTVFAEGETPITSLSLTVDEPVQGATIPGKGDYIRGETEQYKYEYAWYDGVDAGTWPSEETYKKGSDYCALFRVSPKEGYTLAELSRDNITINGKPVNNYAAYQPRGNIVIGKVLMLSLPFPPLHTVRETFTSYGVPSYAFSSHINTLIIKHF